MGESMSRPVGQLTLATKGLGTTFVKFDKSEDRLPGSPSSVLRSRVGRFRRPSGSADRRLDSDAGATDRVPPLFRTTSSSEISQTCRPFLPFTKCPCRWSPRIFPGHHEETPPAFEKLAAELLYKRGSPQAVSCGLQALSRFSLGVRGDVTPERTDDSDQYSETGDKKSRTAA